MIDPSTRHSPATLSSYTGLRLEIAQKVPPESHRILDFGCSDGTLGAYLAARDAECKVDGIEYDPNLCEVAATRLNQVYQTDLNTTDITQLVSFTKYDCLIFADILEHLLFPEQVLSGALAVLRPGGTVILCTPNIRHITAFWSIFVRGTFPRKDRGIFDRTHLRWFARKDLTTLAINAGLSGITLTSSFRLFDSPNGRINHVLRQHSRVFAKLPAFGEFLGYQHILVGKSEA